VLSVVILAVREIVIGARQKRMLRLADALDPKPIRQDPTPG
jgi:hypothetical protein